MRDDRSVRVLLGVIAVLLGLNVVVQVSGLTGPRTAVAATPDSSAQLKDVVDGLKDVSGQVKELGKKLDKMQAFVESGAITVKVGIRDKNDK